MVVYTILFGGWLLLTALWQLDYFRENFKFLRLINTFHILPIWTFFAPRPGMSDTHVLFRDKLPEGTFTHWEEIDLIQARKPFHMFWNPMKRLDKVAVDAISDIKTIKNRGEKGEVEPDILQHQIKLSKGYLLLMNIAFSHPRIDEKSRWRQFVIVEGSHISGMRSITPIFFSPFHDF